jgi:hypothetical protein
MVQRKLKVPKHGGPDGQGLPAEVFEEFLKIFIDPAVSDNDAQQTMELSFSASKQQEWNEVYRLELLKYVDITKK